MNCRIYLDDNTTKYLTNELDRENISYAITKEKLIEGEINCISFEDKPFVLNSVFIAGVAYAKGIAERQEADLIISKALSELPRRKVIIKETNSIEGDGSFVVSTADGYFMRCFSFRLGENVEAMWSKERNYELATEYAKRLETFYREEKTIYETPENDIV